MRSIIKTLSIPRRAVLAGLSGLGISALVPSVAFALSEKVAIDFVRKVLAEVNTIISADKPEDQMLVDFEAIFRDYGEVPLIAKTALGAPGRRASNSQLSTYIAAFQIYISHKYGRQFRILSGDKFNITGSRDAGSKGVLVQCIVEEQNKPSYDLEWWVIDRNGRPKIFDLKIEGISLISTERTEIGAILESFNGDIDKLSAYLRRF